MPHFTYVLQNPIDRAPQKIRKILAKTLDGCRFTIQGDNQTISIFFHHPIGPIDRQRLRASILAFDQGEDYWRTQFRTAKLADKAAGTEIEKWKVIARAVFKDND
uniref:Uncharacterized protein n=1 Tax=viral metagenome TaxID=1070528 RepID=A0A6M3JLJ2_9ZZZZ